MTTPNTPTPPAPPAEDVATLRAEAKNRRLQLREAESQRDALAADLTAARDVLKSWQSKEVRKLVASVVASPETLEALGYDPTAYFGDDHTLNVDAALDDAKKIRDEHGLAQADQTTDLAREIAAELPEHAAIPAELLRGNTAEELRQHRDIIKDWVRKEFPLMPVVPGENAGGTPTTEGDWLKSMLNNK